MLLFSLPTLACVNRHSSAKFIVDDGLECGMLAMVTIENPMIEMNGKRYPLGVSRTDFELDSIERRANSICKSYGFKQQLNVRNYVYLFGGAPSKVAFLTKNKNGKFAPVLGGYDDAYLVIKSIKCLDFI